MVFLPFRPNLLAALVGVSADAAARPTRFHLPALVMRKQTHTTLASELAAENGTRSNEVMGCIDRAPGKNESAGV